MCIRDRCCASGGVPKWLNGADCKSAGYGLRRFESYPHHVVAPVVGVEGWFRWCSWWWLVGVAGVAQLVERKPSKLDVAGSSPVSRSSQVGKIAKQEVKRSTEVRQAGSLA